jgi:hypothetical protein
VTHANASLTPLGRLRLARYRMEQERPGEWWELRFGEAA